MKKLVILLALIGACADVPTYDADEKEPEVAVDAEAVIIAGCTQAGLRYSALGVILDIFWGYREECRTIQLGRGVKGYECGLPEAYVPDRDRPGYDRAIDRFYTRVIPIGPTRSTTVQLQYDQCGDGRAGDPGIGARTPLDSGCVTAGWVTCKCGQGCAVKTVWD